MTDRYVFSVKDQVSVALVVNDDKGLANLAFDVASKKMTFEIANELRGFLKARVDGMSPELYNEAPALKETNRLAKKLHLASIDVLTMLGNHFLGAAEELQTKGPPKYGPKDDS